MTIGSWLARLRRRWFRSRASVRRIAEERFAVLDVDVTGTSIHQDRVTGIAALPVAAGVFRIADLRYCTLADGAGPQAPSSPAGRACYLAIRDLVAGSPIITYNPAFVREMIERRCRADGLPALGGDWIDLGSVASVVAGEQNELATMDYWLEKMKAGGPRPHDAIYDTFAMAQLLQVIIAYAEDAGIDSVEALARSEDLHAWLRG